MNFCTIIAKNYIAHARVLARSLAETQPDARLWTLVIDDFTGYIDPSNEPFEVLGPAEIDCRPFTHMALRYSVLELSTAVKPWLLAHLMAETGGPVTYLDPDIKIYGSLAPLDELAARHGLVLIPHNSRPIPPDGRKPSQVDIMIAGVYNLGYVSVASRPEVHSLLDWWADRLIRDCRVDPIWGYFVDQRWFDLAPGFVTDLAIMRSPEYNVAYWNLHDRRLKFDGGRYLADGRPLSFFHFSGFDPEHPLVLSRHQDRIDVLADPVLEQLLAEYAALVMAEGHAVSRDWPYSYGALGDGTRLDDRLRGLYDDFADEHSGDVASPFTLEGVRVFDRWLQEQAPGSPPGINRVLARVYEDRSDLRAAYPDVAGTDGEALLLWAKEQGKREEPLLARVTRNGDARSLEPASPSAPGRNGLAAAAGWAAERSWGPWGANVVGDFRSGLDLGRAARALVAALDATGIPALPVLSQTSTAEPHSHPYATAAPHDAPFAVNAICLDADVLPEFVKHVGEEFFAGRYSVGLWYLDGTSVAERWGAYSALLEEIWVPTAHAAGVLEPIAEVPVNKIQIPVHPPALEFRSRREVGIPDDKFAFYFGFDYQSGFERKNPLAVLEAFRRAFAPEEGACLILGAANAERDAASHRRLCEATADHPDLEVIDDDLPPARANSLIALSDCYVSLHRAEAFGAEMADAMWFGQPVIATGYSGNLDFMTPENSYLVDHRLVAIGPDHGHGLSAADALWAEPDLDHAAALMRQVFDDRDSARRLGAAAADDIRRSHSPEIAAELLGRRLESIHATGRARRGRRRGNAHPPALAKLPLRIRQGPSQRALGGRGGQSRELMRKTVLRAMQPYTEYQQTVNSELVAALGELAGEMGDLREDATAERAKRMAELRAIDQPAWLRETRIHRVADVHAEVAEIKRILQLQTDRSVYLSVSELQRRQAATAPVAGERHDWPDLTRFELRAFSQNGEDGVLAEILRRVGAPTRFFVEFGIESGREGNCVYLADVAGWGGLFMEAGESWYKLLEHKYVAQSRVRTICAHVDRENVEELFEQGGVPREPDVLSIDVDGQDYWVWEAIENYRPRVVVIEYNSALDPRRRLVQPNDPSRAWDGTDYYGASLGALRALGEGKGYRLVHTDLSGVNAFFVRTDLAGEAFPDPDDVAIRGVPNYYQSGYRHPAARPGRQYLDLDDGELKDGAR